MGYPIGLILSVGESMIVIVAMAIWWCSPVSETPDWWTWSLFGLQKFKVVQVWRCLRATCWTSQSFLGTAPFEAYLNPNSAGIQLWIFPKHIPGAVYDFDRFWSSSHMPFPHFTTMSNHQTSGFGLFEKWVPLSPELYRLSQLSTRFESFWRYTVIFRLTVHINELNPTFWGSTPT